MSLTAADLALALDHVHEGVGKVVPEVRVRREDVRHQKVQQRPQLLPRERIFVELMTSDCKLKASRGCERRCAASGSAAATTTPAK